jgi:hypothetical protein
VLGNETEKFGSKNSEILEQIKKIRSIQFFNCRELKKFNTHQISKKIILDKYGKITNLNEILKVIEITKKKKNLKKKRKNTTNKSKNRKKLRPPSSIQSLTQVNFFKNK